MKFSPSPMQQLHLCGTQYEVEPHPSAVGLVFLAEGGRATVYKLKRSGSDEPSALKVFKKKYRGPEQLAVAKGLATFSKYRGMRAAMREVVDPNDPAATASPDLAYAVIMPWVKATTWYDVLVRASGPGTFRLHRRDALSLATDFLTVMEQLEAAGFAHTDIAAGNVMVDLSKNEAHLLDLEDACFPGALRPTGAGVGTPGYRHEASAAAGGVWGPASDRHAVAVLAAEMLLLSVPSLSGVSDSGLFLPHPAHPKSTARVAELGTHGALIAPQLVAHIHQAINAPRIDDCPRIADLASAARLDLAALRGAESGIVWDSLPIRVDAPPPPRPDAGAMEAGASGAETVKRGQPPVADGLGAPVPKHSLVVRMFFLVCVAGAVAALACGVGATVAGGWSPFLDWLTNIFG